MVIAMKRVCTFSLAILSIVVLLLLIWVNTLHSKLMQMQTRQAFVTEKIEDIRNTGRLYFYGTDFVSLMPVFEFRADIKWIGLEATGHSELGFSSIATLPNLKSLHIKNQTLSDRHLESLCTLNQLEELILESVNIQARDVAKFRSLNKLRELRIDAFALSSETPLFLSELRNIERLYLEDWPPQEVETVKSKMPWCDVRGM